MTLENSSLSKPSVWSAPQRFLRRELLPVLTDLRLAILLLLAIAVFSISGTVIEQGQSVAFYQANYPEHPALFGFLTWKVILTLGLDHVYRTWWFLALLILFGTSLTACTFTRQFPALKAARRWKFYDQPRQFQKLALSAELDNCSPSSLSQLLQNRRYRVFQDGNKAEADAGRFTLPADCRAESSDRFLPPEGDALYARKGIVGRIGPIVVHVGILVILAGGIWGAMTGFVAQEMVPSGESFQVQNIVDAGPWAAPQIPKDWSLRVNRFWIDYTPTGGIDQFYSDLSVLDKQGQEVKRKTIFVNEPLRYRGVTFYQTDWGLQSLRIRINSSPILQLPMAQLNTNGKGRIWGTWIPTKPDLSAGVSLLAKDLQGMLLMYDAKGQLINTLRPGMSTNVNGVTLKIVEVVGSTGLQIKADPGITIVYTGFGLLMLGVVMSYVSHSQIWALQKDGHLYVGGKTNRAQVAFEWEILEILDQLSTQPQAEVPGAAAEAIS